MNAVELIRRLHQHRAWVNGNLLTAAANLSEEQLRAPFPIGQGSVWKSLLHLYGAEYVWLEALLGNDDLRQKWQALERRWAGYLAALTPEALDELVSKKITSSGLGKRFATRRADVLLHVCTHAHYTAAQVVNMLRQVGADRLPDTMLISLARQEATGA